MRLTYPEFALLVTAVAIVFIVLFRWLLLALLWAASRLVVLVLVLAGAVRARRRRAGPLGVAEPTRLVARKSSTSR